jgi:type IV fimbrial biogenesis protein FimT
MNNNFGFTLIELMVAIGILGIISAAAVPNMISWRNNMQFNSAVRMVKISIEDTRMDAIKANMRSRLDFTVGGDTFDSVKWDHTTDTEATPVTHQLPPGIILDKSTVGSNKLIFDPRGMVKQYGTLTIKNVSANTCMAVVIAMTGSSRIEKCLCP